MAALSVILFKLVVALAGFRTIAANTGLVAIFVNDVCQGVGTCIRYVTRTDYNSTEPIEIVNYHEMGCGYQSDGIAARTCPVTQGGKVSFLWRQSPGESVSKPTVMLPDEKGPCAVYLKYVKVPTINSAPGNGWFKIWDEGYDPATKLWCTEKLMKNNGIMSVRIPTDLAGGHYLIRPELISLRDADKNVPHSTPSFYIACAQIYLESPAVSHPIDVVSFPGLLIGDEPGLNFNIYKPTFPYPGVGPPAYNKTTPRERLKPAPLKQDTGALPNDTILENANWFTDDVLPYQTKAGCLKAVTDCNQMLLDCFNNVPPTGSENCDYLIPRCDELRGYCAAGSYSGPPDWGKIRTPKMNSTRWGPIPPAANEKTYIMLGDDSIAVDKSAPPTLGPATSTTTETSSSTATSSHTSGTSLYTVDIVPNLTDDDTAAPASYNPQKSQGNSIRLGWGWLPKRNNHKAVPTRVPRAIRTRTSGIAALYTVDIVPGLTDDDGEPDINPQLQKSQGNSIRFGFRRRSFRRSHRATHERILRATEKLSEDDGLKERETHEHKPHWSKHRNMIKTWREKADEKNESHDGL